MNYYNTRTEAIENERYCSYCGEVAIHREDFEDGCSWHYYFCDCEYAKMEIKKQDIEDDLKLFRYTRQGREVNIKLELLRDKAELDFLKKRYDVVKNRILNNKLL